MRRAEVATVTVVLAALLRARLPRRAGGSLAGCISARRRAGARCRRSSWFVRRRYRAWRYQERHEDLHRGPRRHGAAALGRALRADAVRRGDRRARLSASSSSRRSSCTRRPRPATPASPASRRPRRPGSGTGSPSWASRWRRACDADGPDPPPADEGWRRLHPLSPVARVGRLAPGPRASCSSSRPSTRRPRTAPPRPTTSIVITLVSAVYGYVHWMVTRWRFEGDTLRIETGLIRKDSRRLPLARIQAVDIVRPLLARMLGVSELRVRLAGSGSTDGKLAYLAEAEAAELRLVLLAGHHDDRRGRVEQHRAAHGERDHRAACSARSCSRWSPSSWSARSPRWPCSTSSSRGRPPPSAGFLAVYLLSFAGVVWRRLSGQYGFIAVEGPEGVRIRRGLLQTISETGPLRPDPGRAPGRAAAVAALRVVPPRGRRRRGDGAQPARRGHRASCARRCCPWARSRTPGTCWRACSAGPTRRARRRRGGPASRHR